MRYMARNRNDALDALRLCVTLLVVMHHTVLAYCRYGHFNRKHYLWSSAPIIDAHRWIGFDILQDFNDTYFMSLMFLVSGLFVLPSLRRKGPYHYAKDRICRLGFPFIVCVMLIMPLAYYPSIRQTGVDLSFSQYWHGYFTRFGWPGGPAWFIWFLLALDLMCSILAYAWPQLPRKLIQMPDLIAGYPVRCLLMFWAVACVFYLPVLAVVGPERRFSLGPFAIQESRIGLYTLFFVIGIMTGATGVHHPLFDREGPLSRLWPQSGFVAVTAFTFLLGLQLASLHHFSPWFAHSWQMIVPILFVVCCVSCSITLVGLFIRFVKQTPSFVKHLTQNAYGIYLVHYVFLTWTQWVLLSVQWNAVVKATIVFGTVLSASWAFTALLRRSPFVRRVL